MFLSRNFVKYSEKGDAMARNGMEGGGCPLSVIARDSLDLGGGDVGVEGITLEVDLRFPFLLLSFSLFPTYRFS